MFAVTLCSRCTRTSTLRASSSPAFGRTKEVVLDETTYDANGVVAHLGTNMMGRFAVTLSHLYGPSATPANGFQFTFVDNSVICPMNAFVYRWGIGALLIAATG